MNKYEVTTKEGTIKKVEADRFSLTDDKVEFRVEKYSGKGWNKCYWSELIAVFYKPQSIIKIE